MAGWPNLSDLIVGVESKAPVGLVGAPLAAGSVTAGQCDLAPALLRQTLRRIGRYDVETQEELDSRIADRGDVEIAGLSIEEATPLIAKAVRYSVSLHELTLLVGGNNAVTRPGVQRIERVAADDPILFESEFTLKLLHRGDELRGIDLRACFCRPLRLSGLLLALRRLEIADRAQRRLNLWDAGIPAAGLDRLAFSDRLEFGLRGELQIAAQRLTKRAILVCLRRERGEPALHVAVLHGLRETLANIHLVARERVDFKELVGVGVAVGKRRRIFERCVNQCRAILATFKEKVGLEAMGGGLGDRLADLLLGLAIEVDRGSAGLVGARLSRMIASPRAGDEGGAAQGEAERRADPFFVTHGPLERLSPRTCCSWALAQSSCMFGSVSPSFNAARGRSASLLVTG